jgi:inactivated superfamily I helicase
VCAAHSTTACGLRCRGITCVDRVCGIGVIAIVSAGICAGLAVGCSARSAVLLDQARTVSSARSRLQAESRSPAITWVRTRFVLVQDMLRSFIARITGTDHRRVDRRTLVLLESITRHLRGGASLRTAVMTASTDSPGLFDLVLGASLVDGAPLAEALDEWMNDAVPSKILVGTALRLATDAGGAVATVLDGVAESLRDRLHLDREVAGSQSSWPVPIRVLPGFSSDRPSVGCAVLSASCLMGSERFGCLE